MGEELRYEYYMDGKPITAVFKNCEKPPENDPVNHPSHYTYGSIECIDYLDAIGIGEPFCRGNVIKYTTRLGHKVDDLEDAKKVVWYAQHIVDKLADGTYKREE